MSNRTVVIISGHRGKSAGGGAGAEVAALVELVVGGKPGPLFRGD